MFSGPAFHYDFLDGVELNSVPTLTVQVAEETVLPAAEREVSHGCSHTDIDPDISGRGFVAETASCRSARSKQRCLVSIRATLEEGQRCIHIFGVNQA